MLYNVVLVSTVQQSESVISSVAQWCPTLCNPVDCTMPGFPVHHQLPEPAQTHVYGVSDAISNHLILCCPLLLLRSIFPSIRVFSNESVLHIRWPQYWGFSFSISPENIQDLFPLGLTGLHQLYVYTYSLLVGFPSHLGHHRTLSRVSWARQ